MPASMHFFLVVGRLGRDAFRMPGGFVGIDVASSERVLDEESGKWIDKVFWHKVACTGEVAKFVLKYCKKGGLVGVQGTLMYNRTREGGFVTIVRARDVQLFARCNICSPQEKKIDEIEKAALVEETGVVQ